VDRYSVGTVLITDPAAWVSRRASLEEVWGFTGYLRCTACAAAGPWEATEETRGRVTTLALEAGPDPEDDRLLFGITATFDGTTVRLATEAEAHLRELIEASPEDAYLRDRLGNLYRTAGREDLAHEAYVRALGVDPDCLPALYSAGESFARLGEDDDRAADYLHRALEAAKDSPLSRADRKRLVEGTLYVLAELHERSEGRIDLFPPPEPGGEDVQDEVATVVVHLAQYDLDDPEDVGRLAETFL